MARWKQLLLNIMLFALFAFVVIRQAWISDDAYITFRSVENFVSGYGLGYNPYVRVQSFTHPLWLLIISVGYYFQTRVLEISLPGGLYFLTITISIILSCTAIWLAMDRLMIKPIAALVIGGGGLASKAFIDYSTSGLESPLTYLLLILFLWVYMRSTSRLFWLALLSSLLTLNRLDLSLLVLPALLISLWESRGHWRKNLLLVLAGFMPIILWLLFALLYFGFLFPNTAYAKLNTNIADGLLWRQGMNYLGNSLRWDPITLFVILAAGVGLIFDRRKSNILLYVGALLYLLYVVRIGGDFMSGRFLSAPFLMALAVLSNYKFMTSPYLLASFVVVCFGNLFLINSPLLGRTAPIEKDGQAYIDQYGIADERMVYFKRFGLPGQDFRQSDAVGSPFAGQNWVFNDFEQVLVRGATGMPGYMRGPNIYVIDKYALTDPLLSRLPADASKTWRVGHYERAIPDGYTQTLLTGENQLADPQLATYYDRLSTLVNGPLWSWERLVTIWKFNTGQYDDLVSLPYK